MTLRYTLSLTALAPVALAFALPAPVLAQSVNDFQLPPAPTPSASPQVQGPVDPDNPAPVRPRPTPTPTLPPTARPTPAPTAAATPRPTATTPAPRPTASATRPAPTARPTATATAPAVPATGLPETSTTSPFPVEGVGQNGVGQDGITQDGAAQGGTAPMPLPTAATPGESADAASTGAEPQGDTNWPLWIGLALALLAAIGGVVFWRKRQDAQPPATIEPPLVRTPAASDDAAAAPTPAPTPTPTPATRLIAAEPSAPAVIPPRPVARPNGQPAAQPQSRPAGQPMPQPAFAQPAPQPVPAVLANTGSLAIAAEAVKLTRSFAFITLQYRLTLTNDGDAPITGVAIGADMVSANARAPMEQQVAMADTAIAIRHTVADIAPGQTLTVDGQAQLPLAQVEPIRQGRHPVLVPLMRVRVERAGEDAVVKTLIIGQGAPGGERLQPFSLNDGLRSYQPIAQRELA